MLPALDDFDQVKISGYCMSHGRFFYNQRGTAASVGPLYDQCWKFWLSDVRDDNGKFWFNMRTARVTRIPDGYVECYCAACLGPIRFRAAIALGQTVRYAACKKSMLWGPRFANKEAT